LIAALKCTEIQSWLTANQLNVESSDSKTGPTIAAGGLFQGFREFT